MEQVVYKIMNILYALHNLKIHSHDDIGVDFFLQSIHTFGEVLFWKSLLNCSWEKIKCLLKKINFMLFT